MRKYLIVCLALVAFTCKKNDDVDPDTVDGSAATLTYKVAGVEYRYAGGQESYSSKGQQVYADKITAQNLFVIHGDNADSNRIVILSIGTSNVTTQTYTLNSPTNLTVVSAESTNQYMANSAIAGTSKLTLNISRYSNGTIDGTFSGKLHRANLPGQLPDSITLTDGEFKNVKIIK